MPNRRRHAGSGRDPATRGHPHARRARRERPAVPSATEASVYVVLGAAVSSGVIAVSSRPTWYAAVVLAGAAVVVIVIAVASRATGPARRPDVEQASAPPTVTRPPQATPPTSRRGRRRRS